MIDCAQVRAVQQMLSALKLLTVFAEVQLTLACPMWLKRQNRSNNSTIDVFLTNLGAKRLNQEFS